MWARGRLSRLLYIQKWYVSATTGAGAMPPRVLATIFWTRSLDRLVEAAGDTGRGGEASTRRCQVNSVALI